MYKKPFTQTGAAHIGGQAVRLQTGFAGGQGEELLPARLVVPTGAVPAAAMAQQGGFAVHAVDGVEVAEPVLSEEKCDKCGLLMLIKDGRFGKYLACSGYPACKNIQPLVKPLNTGVVCPECKEGQLIEKKSRFGKLFYSCNQYPKCKFALWDLPVESPCPKCGFPLLVKKVYKRKGEFLKCPKEGCDYNSSE